MSISSLNILSVGLSVTLRKVEIYEYGNAILSAPYLNKQLFFSLYIPLIFKLLFYKYFVLFVGQASKGKNVMHGNAIFLCFL